ncbi:glycosyltransferase family 4 protein [Terriglobus sp. RCC_193]|uniref:glycosyltransferase family 4 protein n=1 Tax=Terriglobus sp. RCC_193 TaxID=3239218 RepID=UPI003525A817
MHLMRVYSGVVLNCSRVGLSGGLKTYSDELMKALIESGIPCHAVLPAGYPVQQGVEPIFTPPSLAGNSDLSLLRPIKWFVYSAFGFPIPKEQRILSTTHQVLPGRSHQIVTIHDLRPYFYPDTRVQKFYFHYMLPRALSKCDGIITVSETSKALISQVYKIAPERIAVIPNCIQPPTSFLFDAEVAECPYILAVGASWRHKNIESFLNQRRVWSNSYRLKVVAGRGSYLTHLQALSSSLGISDKVEFLSAVSPQQLEALYAGCSALIYPSRMEGFGIPPLEAMARMRPAIVSDIPVFRELYGSHALYVDPDDPASWERAMSALATLTPTQLEDAKDHALAYNQERMAIALRKALNQFWPL